MDGIILLSSCNIQHLAIASSIPCKKWIDFDVVALDVL